MTTCYGRSMENTRSEEKEMKTKDRKGIKKISEYDLKKALIPYADQRDGIVRIERNSCESEEQFHTIQEQHNANHALYYFSMISDAVIRGRSTGNDCEKIRRIKEHMTNLREFVGEDKTGLQSVIKSLLEQLERFCPRERKEFVLFIYQNWELIHAFAEAYGHHDRCFPKDKYQKLKDVISGTYYFKLWWWKIRASKARICFQKWFEEVINPYQRRNL